MLENSFWVEQNLCQKLLKCQDEQQLYWILISLRITFLNNNSLSSAESLATTVRVSDNKIRNQKVNKPESSLIKF